MGQNLNTCIVYQQKGSDVKKETKLKIPFSKLPDKAVFNYITPVNFHEQNMETLTSYNFLSCVSEDQIETDDFLFTIANYKSIKEIKVKWNSFIKMKQKNYLQDYEIVKNVIGKGGFGVVRKVKSKFTNQIRVAKVVRKRLMKQDDITKLFTQLYIMKMLDHPNIIKLYEVYEYEDQFILIIEMCTGGQVFSKSKKKKIPQKKAASIIKQVLRALIYMHNQRIVHRDIKPENMLFQNQSKNTVKLIDFGIAAKIQEDTFLEDRIGTPSYIAPEIIYKKYNQKCDVWAAGISFYQFISGKTPFTGQNDSQVLRQILRGEISFQGSIWQKVSKQCKSIIKLMLTKKVQERPSAKQLFEHNYFCSIEEIQKTDHTSQRNSVINNIHHFRFKNKLQAVVQTFIASQLLTQQEKQTLVEIFKQFDVNHDGVISNQELMQALKSKGSMTESKIEQVMKVIDTNGSGEIDYTEFLVANCDITVQLTKQRLKQVFQYFDTDHSGTITYSQVAEFLQDYESSQEQIRNIFKLVDANGDGHISEDEFIDLLITKANSFTEIKEGDEIEKAKIKKRKQLKANNKQDRDKARRITFQGINQLLGSKKGVFQALLVNK